MKKNLLLAALVLLSLSACRRQAADSKDHNADGLPDTTLTEGVADSTIYGTACEFGMSTFSLRDASGRLYEVTRMSEDGQDGRIYGDLEEGQQYAMTLQADSTAIDVLYNLTQLRALVKDFYIVNGQLVITTDGKSEVVRVEELDEAHFLGTGTSGKKYEYKK